MDGTDEKAPPQDRTRSMERVMFTKISILVRNTKSTEYIIYALSLIIENGGLTFLPKFPMKKDKYNMNFLLLLRYNTISFSEIFGIVLCNNLR